jgi:hypothetical protein
MVYLHGQIIAQVYLTLQTFPQLFINYEPGRNHSFFPILGGGCDLWQKRSSRATIEYQHHSYAKPEII